MKLHYALQLKQFPQPFGKPFRHPLEAEVVGMGAIHQAVHAGRTQQIGAFHQLQMGIAGGNAATSVVSANPRRTMPRPAMTLPAASTGPAP